jgi:hypothetical protein
MFSLNFRLLMASPAALLILTALPQLAAAEVPAGYAGTPFGGTPRTNLPRRWKAQGVPPVLHDTRLAAGRCSAWPWQAGAWSVVAAALCHRALAGPTTGASLKRDESDVS